MRFVAIAITALAFGTADPPLAFGQAASAFDGTWTGNGTLTRRSGAGTACGPETTDRRFTIRNGVIEFPYDARSGVTFSGPIAADGSFSLSHGSTTFIGRATGSTLAATYTGRQCEREFRMRRRAG